MVRRAHPSHDPDGISIGSAVFAQLTAEWPRHVGACHSSPPNCSFPWGIWTTMVRSLGPPDSASQTASRLIQMFLHSLRKTVHIFYNGN